jgi:hypothetical protein
MMVTEKKRKGQGISDDGLVHVPYTVFATSHDNLLDIPFSLACSGAFSHVKGE